jgi:aryl-alcohol dehydrogenase-like predicted oxidoreductase
LSFGSSDFREWILNEEDSREIIERAVDLGVNYFDTANAYSFGESERTLGNVLSEYDRDSQVIATKVYHGMDRENPNAKGLSRKAVDQELENSLDRLGVDSIDLYQIHRHDRRTPMRETLEVLDDAVRRNKVRYVGASSMWAYQFADALHTADRFDLERFVSMQNHYNLVYREEEREMIPLCEEQGVGVVPWSPLARGYLTRPDEEFLDTARAKYMDENEHYVNRIRNYRGNGGIEINERVEELATNNGVTMAQIALAWLLHQDAVDAPIIGTTSVEHLEDAVEALEISLSDSDLDYLAEPYEPTEVDGHQ